MIEFKKLIDRLQEISNINYPDRPWTPEFRHEVEELWHDKIDQLIEKLATLEARLEKIRFNEIEK